MAVTIGGRGTGGPNGPARGTGADVSQREDLSNVISNITRDETPFLAMIGKTTCKAIYHEWQTDELAAPGNSRIGEGQDYLTPTGLTSPSATPAVGEAFATTGPDRTRLGNYTQINGKTVAVSGTRKVIDQAGVEDEFAYQLKKRGIEMKRDIEMDLLNTGNVSNAAGTHGNPNARTMGGISSFINDTAKNAIYAGTGASLTAGGSDGTGVVTLAADADRGALSIAHIDELMQKIYENGGKADVAMMSPKQRRAFSSMMHAETGTRRNLDEKGSLRQSVDVYMSDFGAVKVVPNYIMGLTTPGAVEDSAQDWADAVVYLFDPSWFKMAVLRPFHAADVGQVGDSTRGMFVEEQSFEVSNPMGCGVIYNVK